MTNRLVFGMYDRPFNIADRVEIHLAPYRGNISQPFCVAGKRVHLIILAVLTVLAAWLRFAGLRFGIPGTFRPDEEYLINPALSFRQDWNPHFAIYPAAQMYLQHIALWVYAAAHGQSSDFRSFYEGGNYPTAHVVGRTLSALMGTATVPAIYFAGASILGANASLAASAIMAVATLHVLNSKFATTDVAVVFWLVLTFAMVLRIARDRLRSYLSAGFFAGLAMATKYPAAAVAFGILATHLYWVRKGGRLVISLMLDKRLFIAALTMISVFFCATPYVLLDRAQTVHDYEYQREFVLHGISPAGFGWHWLLLRAMPDSFGLGLEILMIGGLIWALIRCRAGAITLFLAVTFFGLLSSHQLYYRYLLVPFPAMALLAGVLVADLGNLAARHLGKTRGIRVVAAVFTLLLMPSLIRDIQLDRLLKRTDTRIIALRFLHQHVPCGTEIAEIDQSTPYGKVPFGSCYHAIPFDNPVVLRSRGVRMVVSDIYPPLYYSPGPSATELQSLRTAAALVFDTNPIRSDVPQPIYDPNDAFYVPFQHMSSVTRPGPHILIWQLK